MKLSIITPLYNEEENVQPLHKALTKALSRLSHDYEIIAIDDGSKDNTWENMVTGNQQDSKFKIIKFRKNAGQTAAMSAGIDYATGDIIIPIDADLENDPNDIPKLLSKLDEGYDIVSGWRKDRWGSGVVSIIKRRIPSEIANFLIRKITGLPFHDSGCTLKAYRKEVLEGVKLYGDMHRFIPAVSVVDKDRVAEVVVNYQPRQFGVSKYGFGRTIKVFLDLILLKFLIGYATHPIQFFGLWGLLFGGIGFVTAAYLTLLKIFTGASIGSRPLLLFAVLLMILGTQLIMMGLLGELGMRTYYESQGKKTYIVEEKRGI